MDFRFKKRFTVDAQNYSVLEVRFKNILLTF